MLRDGVSIDIVGSRDSGRSHFIGALSEELSLDGVRSLTIRGVASFRTTPLAALGLAADTSVAGDGRSGFSLRAAVQSLLAVDSGIILVDDWDDLDEASWGAIEFARREHGITVALSRLKWHRARHTPTGLIGSTHSPSDVFELYPFRIEELDEVLSEHLQDPIEPFTMSRIYEKSGGVVGIARRLVDTAVRDNRLRKSNGRWVGIRNMWSPMLRGTIESYLEELSEEEREALEILALTGAIDLTTVSDLFDTQLVESLEQRGVVRVLRVESRALVTIGQPLVIEYFRNEPNTARDTRIKRRISTALGASALPGAPADVDDHGDSIALLSRVAREMAKNVEVAQHSEWVRSKSPEAAFAYVKTLMRVPGNELRIDDVFEATQLRPDAPFESAELAGLRIIWLALGHQDLKAAQDYVDESEALLGDFGALIRAVLAQVSLMVGSPSACSYSEEASAVLPPKARAEILLARLFALIAAGSLAEARVLFDSELLDTEPGLLWSPMQLQCFLLVGEGRLDDALHIAESALDEAATRLDADNASVYGMLAALALFLRGETATAETRVGQAVAVGLPFVGQVQSYVGLLTLGGIMALRRSNLALARHYQMRVHELDVPPGALPGQSSDFLDVQLLASRSNLASAGDKLRKVGDELWRRGAKLSAGLYQALALEHESGTQRLKTIERLESGTSPLLAAQLEWVRASVDRDLERLEAVIPALLATGRYGLVLNALRTAFEIVAEENDLKGEKRLRELERSLPPEISLRSIDSNRFFHSAGVLSSRENEVVRFVAEGLTNQQIADRLMLSVRTVESHMRRILRKLDLHDRHELTAYISAR